MNKLPIDVDLLFKRKEIPKKLAQLSYFNSEAAIEFLRMFGEKKLPISPLYDEILKCFHKVE